jgi:hypothetical protein
MITDEEIELLYDKLLLSGSHIKLPKVFFDNHLTILNMNTEGVVFNINVENIETGIFINHSKNEKGYFSLIEILSPNSISIKNNNFNLICDDICKAFSESVLTTYSDKYSIYYNIKDF